MNYQMFERAVIDSNPVHFLSNPANISSWAASSLVYAYAEKYIWCPGTVNGEQRK